MKHHFAPHLGRDIILGACKLPDPHAPMIRLARFAKFTPDSPIVTTCDYSAPAMSVITNIEGNDKYGDCVEAEEAHFLAIMTGNAGTLFSYTATAVLAMYSALTGFDANTPGTDLGTDPIACMNYFLANAYADGSKNLGYVQVDCTNQQEVMFAISQFGNLKLWLGLPNSWVNPMPTGNGFVWDIDTSDPSNGHCIGSCGYNSPRVVGANNQGVQIMTWGLIGTITWRALAALCTTAGGGGAATRVTPDWLNRAIGQTPTGANWQSLIQAFDSVGGGIALPAAPPAGPSTPLPTAPPSLVQAQSAVSAALNNQQPLITRATALDVANAALAPLWPAAA